MTGKELLYVKTIAEVGNMSKAAKKLFIAQPSLSQSLQRLEDTLGAPLFNRTPGGLTLTYIGEKYYQAANQILKIYGDLEVAVSDLNNLKTGRIHLGITTHLGSIVLPKVLPLFHEQCPSIEIYITEANSTILEEKLVSGDLDFAIIHISPVCQKPIFKYSTLRRDPFIVIASADSHLNSLAEVLPGYPYPVLDLNYLKEEPLLVLQKQQRIRQVSEGILNNAGLHQLNTVLTLGNYRTAQLLATEGYGVTLVPTSYSVAVSYDKKPSIFSIHDKYDPYWNMCITTVPEGYLSKADLRFIETMKAALTC
ncbi:MAG: LysR family transcriptional regulator [Enterocloster asparagiformis]|nr:LysR family transcriptional regulator [Enterocloster asparagiformis]